MSPNRLWAPWREKYLKNIRTLSTKKCIFCVKKSSNQEQKNLVITRGHYSFSMLNLYPYNNGHLLIAPYRHVGRLESMTSEEWLEIFSLVKDAFKRLRKVMSPDGYNVGFNLGRVAGAGILGHVHLHIVPRWAGDINFMPIISGTKVVSQSLKTAQRLLVGAGSRHGTARRR